MHSSALVVVFRRFAQLPFVLLFGLILFLYGAGITNAQTTSNSPQKELTPTGAPQPFLTNFKTSNLDDNVPRDTHTLAQVVTIDVLSALVCTLSGIDPIPNHTCVTYNPISGKLGIPTNENTFGQAGTDQKKAVGGLLGFMAGQIGYLYQPTISSSQYFEYLSHNFGIVKPAYAQANAQLTNCVNTQNGSFGYGYCGLNPIFNLWKMARDFAFAILVIALVVLGLGIMLRFQAEPRVIMTLQNQIPRVVVAILLITFSYAIAGFMIDLMWTVTYMGINTITSGATGQVCVNDVEVPISSITPIHLLETPLAYVDTIFHSNDCGAGRTGLGSLAWSTGKAVSTTIADLLASFMGEQQLDCGIGFGSGNVVDCFSEAAVWLVKFIAFLIIIITLIITLKRVWFELLKCAVLLLVYSIGGPIWIVFGLLPGKPLGFEKWLRLMFAHLAAFPLVAFALVMARVLTDTYPSEATLNFDPNNIFVPPLIGNPHAEGLGALLAFGLILITPGIPNMIKERMKVPPGKMGGQIRGAIAAGATVAGTTSRGTVGRLFRRADPMTGEPAGYMRDKIVGRMVNAEGKLKTPFKLFGRFAYGASKGKAPGH